MATPTQSATPPLESILGHSFARPELLSLAVTHRSHVYDAGAVNLSAQGYGDPSKDNEQMEFLGDAVLGVIAADFLYRRYPASREGDLTRLRSTVVSRAHLGRVGTRLGIPAHLILGPTAVENGSRDNPVLTANALEALIAALYLDGGLEAARRFVEREILADLPAESPGASFFNTIGDYKTALQELLQATSRPKPEYLLVGESGPAHRRVFRMEVRVEGKVLAYAERTSKKAASQEAARLAVAVLEARAAKATGR